jgi:hypothetical protein
LKDSLLAPFDEPPGEGDELPQVEVVDDAPAALPRLSIVHLLMWTATTAAAILPLSWWNVRADSTVVTTRATLVMSVVGLASGTYLFVLAVALIWRRRGLRFEPGHWLALAGAVGWAQSVLEISMLYAGRAGIDVTLYFQSLRMLVKIGLFILFLWLAFRAREVARWRWTFVICALAPVIGQILGVALMFAVWNATPGLLRMTGNIGAQALQALVLLNALTGDRFHRTPRHWTHWMGSVAYLVALAASTAIHAAYEMFPQLLSIR